MSPQILVVSLLAGWLNQEQQRVLDYLQEENRVLKEQSTTTCIAGGLMKAPRRGLHRAAGG